MIDRFDAAEPAPEGDDPDLWAKLCDLIPCNDFAGCGDECECAEGELRLAVQRLIVAERVHHADCGDDEDCCNATTQRARLVNKAAALTGDRFRARRTALRGLPLTAPVGRPGSALASEPAPSGSRHAAVD